MSKNSKQISSPFSTGGGGNNFETNVQAVFVALMLTGGFAPCLPAWPIRKIKLQGKYKGFDTDDLIVFISSLDGEKERRLLGQVKHSISITEGNKVFGEVIQAAWNDFNNPKIFTAGHDAIALITGPLSASDISDVRTSLERARHSEDAADFLTQIRLGNFCSDPQRKKLQTFRVHLKNANGGIDVSENDLWQFMKSFHLLGYDLDIKAGGTLSLLQSLICQYSSENAQSLWTQIIEEVRSANQNAGTITIDSLPEELRSVFKRRTVETIPADLIQTPWDQETTDWSTIPYASELAISSLLGSWNENSDADMVIAGQLAAEEYGSWITKIREILQMPESPITLKNGKWTITRRMDLWQKIGPRLFDEQLDRFKQCAVNILKEPDPKFELPPEERYAASIHGKVSLYSGALKKGIAESLALLGSRPQALNHCSTDKAENIAALAVREIFEEADWILWGSLNGVLPLLAEAAPSQFLNAVESTLQRKPCPFIELFAQEGNGITGGNYMTGLLWALETLAWDEQYLTRATVILGEIAILDPGGTWSNRPADSLTTIYLPWYPQTTASVEKRKIAIRTLQKELPNIAWKLLLTLLPNQYQTSTGAHKPVWRWTIPEKQSKEINQREYWNQVSFYSDMAVDVAKNDLARLTEMVEDLNDLPQPAFDKFLEHLGSEEITGKPEKERLPLWAKLVEFVSKHKKYADAKWALSTDLVGKISKITKSLAPQSPMSLYRRLFSSRDFDLYEESGNWEDQQRKLEERRQHAIREILTSHGLGGIIEFAKDVESPWHVGFFLGVVADDNTDSAILPKLLDLGNNKIAQFTSGFVWGRYQNKGWEWVDQTNTSDWSTAQIGQFLTCLPFIDETWKRSEQLLDNHVAEYWSKVDVNPYQAEESLNKAIDKLMEYNRPNAALSCLYRMLHNKQSLDQAQTVKALLAAVSSKEPAYSIDVYHAIDIIKTLQNNPETNPDDLFRVEWAYLSILERDRGTSPKLLEQRLASDPDFFCEVIRLVYRSRNESKSEKEPIEQQKAIATNAYRLLHKWRTPPGTQTDGSFFGDHFNKWLDSVKKACSGSGHIEVALFHVGNVFIHCPPDPSGLWINSTVADAMNAKDAEDIRRGFRLGIFNSRGAHWIDPTGTPEKELAVKYRQQAEEVEAYGYQRLAVTLRDLADSYEREADRIIDEHKREEDI
ncbi:MAG TPA: hypothetical protein ENG83_09895 [Nitrospirae bacterium]|nr:hypothetical protein [Nitrospirota bacterium]HDZ02203.1 hypothetical protein [Nitrospirota bacterium]